MNADELLEQLKKPETYGPTVTTVKVLQTHISYIFLTGEFAYKVKKPVNFGFLDFSTLAKRKFFCEEELRLNQRLCPVMYLEVVPLTYRGKELHIGGMGTVVEYAVKMKQFSQNQIMTNRLQQGKVNPKVIKRICEKLVDFYSHYPTTEEIASYGRFLAVKQNIDENFEQTQSKIGVTISKQLFDEMQRINHHFFSKKKSVFEQRCKTGFIHDCHGDLHSGNIVVTDDILIFDCIEFNKRFRYCDIASDIGFLAMDLDFLNHPYLSSYFIQCYVEKSADTDVFSVLNFYKCYRAYVRGKVAGFRLDDPHIEPHDKDAAVTTAQAYFMLARYYSHLLEIELRRKKPILFLVGGLTGTGKSTIAGKIAVDYAASLINTDVVRKESAGIDKFQRHHDAFNTGLYDPRNIDTTYQQVMEKAQYYLKQNQSVVLDATFVYQRHRDMAIKTAKNLQIPLILIQCTCDSSLVKQRLEKRLKQRSVSDGRWEIYQQQTRTMDPYQYTSNYLEFNTGNEDAIYRMEQFNNLVTMVKKAVI